MAQENIKCPSTLTHVHNILEQKSQEMAKQESDHRQKIRNMWAKNFLGHNGPKNDRLRPQFGPRWASNQEPILALTSQTDFEPVNSAESVCRWALRAPKPQESLGRCCRFCCLLTVQYVVRVSTPLSPCFLGRVWEDLLIVNACSVLFGCWPHVVCSLLSAELQVCNFHGSSPIHSYCQQDWCATASVNLLATLSVLCNSKMNPGRIGILFV